MNSSFTSASSPLPSMLRRSKAQARGFSLLEVAIALVIFVFGALAIVRIFPGALRVITVGGSRQNALNLNRATLARVQSGAFTAPYATYDVGQNYDFSLPQQGWVDGYSGDGTALHPAEPRAVLGSTSKGYSLPRTSNLSDVEVSSLGSIRAVVGEGTVVHQTNDNPPVLFVLTQFPIFSGSSFRVWEEENVDGVTVDNNGSLDFSNARFASGEPLSTSTTQSERPDNTYLRNTDSLVSPNLVYYVTYRYQVNVAGTNRIWGVNDEPLVLAQDNGSYDARVTQRANVVPGLVTVRLRRRVTPLHAPDSFGSSSYMNMDGSRGLILDLPNSLYVGNGLLPNPRSLQAGDKVTVDYQADWGRVLQEGTPDSVPEAISNKNVSPNIPTTRQFVLAAPFIDDRTDDSVYTLCYNNLGGSSSYIRGGWAEYGFSSDNEVPTGNPPRPNLLLPTEGDTKASRITFDLGSSQGFTSRASYRTRDNWSQQLSVAASSYKPFVNNQIEPWRDYYLDGSVLYFHATEAGKSVMVTYSYISNGGTTVTLRNRLLSIEDDPRNQPPAAFASSKFASKLQLTNTDGDELSAPHTPPRDNDLVSISGVRGASVTVRTAWLDGSRYTQSFLTAMRAGTGAEAMP